MTAWLPDGDYAIVEMLGHRTYAGRVSEIERFGSKLCAIEPIYKGALLEPVLISGGSIYQFTPCTKTVALAYAPTEDCYLAAPVRERLPVELLASETDMKTFVELPDFLRPEDA